MRGIGGDIRHGGWWAGLAFAVLAVVVGCLLAHRALAFSDAFEEANAASAQSTEVIEASDGVLIALLDAQRGLRGYLITQDDRFLDEWERGERDLPLQLERLQQLAERRPHSRQAVEVLVRRADKAMAFGRRALALARAGQWSEAEALVRTGQGKRRMDEARAVIDGLKGAAKLERDMRRMFADDMADVSVTAARGLALWSAAVALVLLALGWRTMRRQIDAVDHRRRDAVPGRRGAAGGGHPA